ncbi:MAG: 2-oxoacid:acceptor oxidoreductase subunit alpha [Patescibacteria group bacterium]|nr:2-oxoacid:acceptor oxidoreductase subunit alpha [Patescibacteria group bacterium]
MQELSLLIGGEAGQGVESSGHMLGLNFARAGLNVFAMNEFASQIRGGHNFHKVRVSNEEVHGHLDNVNMILALNKETVDRHVGDLVEGGVVIYDADAGVEEGEYRDDVKFLAVPLKKTALDMGGKEIMQNTTGIGTVFALLDFELEIFEKILEEKFSEKGERIVKLNKEILKAGYDFAKENFDGEFPVRLNSTDKEFMFLNGNDAICLGALKSGCKFVAEYPMTPSSSILHIMASYAYDYGIVVKHTEDEIAAVNMLTGAAFAGVRCMTGTSGGGFSLMTEGCGVAGNAELPIVIVNVQRPGPSTGLPTRTEQSDLRQVMHASQGDYPRMVVAPGDADECFYEAFRAFNLADKYQLPVFILSDKYLGEAAKTVAKFNEEGLAIDRGKLVSEVGEDYKRFAMSDDGVSPRVLPGTPGGRHLASSYEHNEKGFHTEEPEERSAMMEKRMKKMEGLLAELEAPKLIGAEDADATLVTWGSSKETCISAVKKLARNGVTANILQIKYMVPFHKKEIGEILARAKKKINVEMNYSGQLAGLIKQETGMDMDGSVLKYSGRPFTGLEIANKVKELL